MPIVLIDNDEVGCVPIIELIDFVETGQDRQIPPQLIDKEAFARLKHGTERNVLTRSIEPVDHLKHGLTPWRRKDFQLNRKIETRPSRSEEHTYELPSLMHTSYAVFCLQKQ